jgi:hypothetical protein
VIAPFIVSFSLAPQLCLKIHLFTVWGCLGAESDTHTHVLLEVVFSSLFLYCFLVIFVIKKQNLLPGVVVYDCDSSYLGRSWFEANPGKVSKTLSQKPIQTKALGVWLKW